MKLHVHVTRVTGRHRLHISDEITHSAYKPSVISFAIQSSYNKNGLDEYFLFGVAYLFIVE